MLKKITYLPIIILVAMFTTYIISWVGQIQPSNAAPPQSNQQQEINPNREVQTDDTAPSTNTETVVALPPINTSFTYQGYLDDNSAPADGIYDFEFRLFDNNTGGVQVGPTLVITDVAVANGIFTLPLDFGPGIFLGDARWLETRVARDGEGLIPLSPMQELTAVPYATYADFADFAAYGEDADADPGNEFNTNFTLNGNNLELTDNGGTQSVDLSPLLSNNDYWNVASGSDTTANIYRPGSIVVSSFITNSAQYRLTVQNYSAGESAVRGLNQSGSSPTTIYAEGHLGVLDPSSTYDNLPVDIFNIGVYGLAPDNGASAAAVYGWNYDDNSNNYGGVFVANGIGQTNYAVYAKAKHGSVNNYAAFFDGTVVISDTQRLGIHTDSPETDIHLVQSNAIAAGADGFTLQLNTAQWKIYHSGSHLSFAENGIRRAYIEAGTGAWTQISDMNMKKNIEPYNNEAILPRVMALNPAAYHYNDQEDSAAKSIGFLAQEVETVFPELVRINEDGGKALAYDDFAVLSIAAIQEQQTQIEAQQTQIEALQAENDELRGMIADIHAQLNGEQTAFHATDNQTQRVSLAAAINNGNNSTPPLLLTQNISWLAQFRHLILPALIILLLLINLGWVRQNHLTRSLKE
ncbi:MAG TPA: tail fiber domain-containing protein [Anaerolineae bacterium]|nr:tail fiber domain-containing protein [Anaerolineae bacterium]